MIRIGWNKNCGTIATHTLMPGEQLQIWAEDGYLPLKLWRQEGRAEETRRERMREDQREGEGEQEKVVMGGGGRTEKEKTSREMYTINQTERRIPVFYRLKYRNKKALHIWPWAERLFDKN